MHFRNVSRRNFIAGGLALAAVNVVGTGRAAAGMAPPWEGSGTLEDPFVVTTLDELQAMNNAPGAHFVLGNDIDASRTAKEGFVPIGAPGSDYAFSGSLDGQGFTIDGLTINRPGEGYAGLFGYVTGTVQNLSLTNVNVDNYLTGTTTYHTGGLVGYLRFGLVESVSAAGTVAGYDQVGGLVGRTNYATVRDASAAVTVTTNRLSGGLVGFLAYDAVYDLWLDEVGVERPDPVVPDAQFVLTTRTVVFDDAEGTVSLVCTPLLRPDDDPDAVYDDLELRPHGV